MKSILLCSVSMLVLCMGGPACAAGAAFRMPKDAKILYDQNSHDNGVAINSQNFTGGSSTSYNDRAADDFVVPKGRAWTITEVDVTGNYFQGSGPASSEDLVFYQDKNGMPGRPLSKGTFDNIDGGRGPNFALTLPKKGLQLPSGRYWVSVIANLGFYPYGLWSWEMNNKQYGNEAMWENPSGYFGICKTWGTLENCAGYRGDLMFDLRGTSKKLRTHN